MINFKLHKQLSTSVAALLNNISQFSYIGVLHW